MSDEQERRCLEVVRSGPRRGETCGRSATYTYSSRDFCSQHANALFAYGDRMTPIAPRSGDTIPQEGEGE